MFHTYVLAASGNVVDFDRAAYLMDRDLLDQSIAAMQRERDHRPRSDATYDAQWVWDHYCQRHVETYGRYFVPDVNPSWDRPSTPLPAAKPVDLGPTPERFVRVLGADRKRRPSAGSRRRRAS